MPTRLARTVVFLLLTINHSLFPGLLAAEPASEWIRQAPNSSNLDVTLAEIVRRYRIPGLVVGVIDSGVPVYSHGFGVTDIATKSEVTPKTLFNIASITKTFTAMAILQLVEKGDISLDEPIEKYLPVFVGSNITITQLLTHTAGLQDKLHATDATSDAAVSAYVEAIAKQKSAYLPGEGWEYSDADFNVLGALIESVSGQSYPDYIQEHILKTVGMRGSTFRFPHEGDDLAWPHTGETFVRRASANPRDRIFLPSSGLYADITDMMQWASINLNRDSALLSATSYEQMFQPRLSTNWSEVKMGLGWQLERDGDRWLPRHPGGDTGFRALLTLYPKERRAIIIMSNGETTPRIEIRHVVEAIIAGHSVQLPSPSLTFRYPYFVPGLLALLGSLSVGVIGLKLRRKRLARHSW